MIVKRNLNLIRAIPYVGIELTLALLTSVVVFLVYHVGGVELIAIPNVLPAVLGTALAIFLGFRNSAAYGRWQEAARTFETIGNYSRTFARLIVTFVQSHKHTDSFDADSSELFKREMIYRQLAWLTTLRMELLDESDWKQFDQFLSESDYRTILSKDNKTTALLVMQGHNIYDAMRSGTLQGFDSFQLEGSLAQLSALATNCLLIKHIPIPRQYTFFTRLFVLFFILVLPFCFIDVFAQASRAWVVIPITVLLAFVFGIVERTGAVNEEPFENRITDVPLRSMCISIERDLREILDETDLPAKLEPKDGYLW